jgi:nucleoside phosphorylase
MNGLCVTGDQFIDDEEKIADLKDKFEADICEMEAFAVLSVAREYDALDKCIVIKAVSDGANSEAKDAHMDNLQFAMNNSVIVLEFVL